MKELNLVEILLASGPVVKFVLLILIVCSILSWALIYKKYQELKKVRTKDQEFDIKFKAKSPLAELYQYSKVNQDSSRGQVFISAYQELLNISDKVKGEDKEKAVREYFKGHGTKSLTRAIEQGRGIVSSQLDDNMSILASIGSVTPFIGLFGTVWGIINSFSGLASGGGTIEAVAPGIAEALVATAVGLAAAIPAVWFFNHFNNQISKLDTELESFGKEYLNTLERYIFIPKEK